MKIKRLAWHFTQKCLRWSIVVVCMSCVNRNEVAQYHIKASQVDSLRMPMLVWNVCGAFTAKEDSLLADSVLRFTHQTMEKRQCGGQRKYCYSGAFHPTYNQLDLREVYGIHPEDTTHTLTDRITYLHCEIESEEEFRGFLDIKTSMPCTPFLNADTLLRRVINGHNFYPLHLKKGRNDCVVKLTAVGSDFSFEAAVTDSISLARHYADCQNGVIIYPIIDAGNPMLRLTNDHQNLQSAPVSLQLYDVRGDSAGGEIVLEKDIYYYPDSGLEKNTSYICEMTLCGNTVRQPVLCGDVEETYSRFWQLHQQLPDGHPRKDEAGQLLFRLNFLMHHPTRETDWWWQFKIPALTYQLEHMFSHLNQTYGESDTEANIQFITYRSETDDSLQRYILARPNKVDRRRPLPLVVVIRPNIENLHHFFASPQLARQWGICQMQMMSNKYGFLVVMPEMRTYLSEDLTPLAERELKLALADVRRHYPVDTTRMFLHANCSGGYRALRVATENPGMFRAIGLYAPMYHRDFPDTAAMHRAPEHFLSRLKGTPMMIHGDPFDRHSPYVLYKDLIDDCRKYGIPLTLSMKRNTGPFYNIVLVGEEVFEFFKNSLR